MVIHAQKTSDFFVDLVTSDQPTKALARRLIKKQRLILVIFYHIFRCFDFMLEKIFIDFLS
jgi:hypothetical protein